MRMPSESSGDFKPAPAGMHPAVCIQVIDLGSHLEGYQGGPTKMRRKVRIAWELPNELMSDGRPFVVGKRYTLSSSQKSTFRQHLEAWRGQPFKPEELGPGGFEPKKLLGVPCLLSLLHEEREGRTYANIASIGPLVKGMDKPKATNPLLYFSMEDPPDPEGKMAKAFASLPEYWQKEIEKSPEFAIWKDGGSIASDLKPPPHDGLDDDIPF